MRNVSWLCLLCIVVCTVLTSCQPESAQKQLAPEPRYLLEEFTSEEVGQLLLAGELQTAVITAGSTEQHGKHLPLASDALAADWLGKEITKALGKAVLCPVLRVGDSRHHMKFPGTLTLQPETLRAVLRDMAESLVTHGFREVIILPTHGGNFAAVGEVAASMQQKYPERTILGYADVLRFVQVSSKVAASLGVSAGEAGAHAGETETSINLAIRPDLVRLARREAGYMKPLDEKQLQRVFREGIHAVSPNGVLGDPAKASAEHGRTYLDALKQHLLEWIAEERKKHAAAM